MDLIATRQLQVALKQVKSRIGSTINNYVGMKEEIKQSIKQQYNITNRLTCNKQLKFELCSIFTKKSLEILRRLKNSSKDVKWTKTTIIVLQLMLDYSCNYWAQVSCGE
ncbi:Hypothetical_protein [Hexamita inflata]|uniref:Hypothetical_protein n=1 Tax=Hexamita inflata TaxID=28002 RepID=A0AA86PM01_9EUKA|nr:Hypothetical protein HINF_LOCUS27233 [Hexamita inflata]